MTNSNDTIGNRTRNLPACSLRDNMEIYGTAGQATDDGIKWHMRIACWIPRATNTRSECITVIAFALQERAIM